MTVQTVKKMIEGGCKNGYHKMTDDMESPLTLNLPPGAQNYTVDGFSCTACGCVGYMHITVKQIHWLDAAELESIANYESEDFCDE